MKIVYLTPFYLKHKDEVYACDSWETAFIWWRHYHEKGFSSAVILDNWVGELAEVILDIQITQSLLKFNHQNIEHFDYQPCLVNLRSATPEANSLIGRLTMMGKQKVLKL